MKKVLKYLDFTFLRLLPTLFWILNFCLSLGDAFKAMNNMENYYTIQRFFYNTLPILAFLFLGVVSIFKWFNKNIKFLKHIQYVLCVIAVMQIGVYTLELIENFTQLSKFRLYEFLFYFQDAVMLIVFLIIIVSCLLKDKFYKAKWILAILSSLIFCALMFYNLITRESMCSVMNLRVWFHTAFSFRSLINSISFNFPILAVSILGLAPVKRDKIGDDLTNPSLSVTS